MKISKTYFDRYENQGNTDENCLLMKNNLRYENWYDYSCDAKSWPICQKFPYPYYSTTTVTTAKTMTKPTTISSTTNHPEPCEYPQYKGDNICDDGNNNAGCNWDGGDCCGNHVNQDYCQECLCKDPNDPSWKTCPEGWTNINDDYDDRTGCFYFAKDETPMTWQDAQDFCMNMSFDNTTVLSGGIYVFLAEDIDNTIHTFLFEHITIDYDNIDSWWLGGDDKKQVL